MFTREDEDEIVSNYLTEIYNNCNKIITNHDTNDPINSLFNDLDNYATSEFEKYDSKFSSNIENIFKCILSIDYSFLDETTRQQLQNIIDLYGKGVSKFISLYNIKEIPNPHSDVLIRFLNYEIKDNFEKFYLYSFLLPALHKLTQICVNRQSSIYNGILVLCVIEIKNNLIRLIKKKEIIFFKKYLIPDLKLIYEKTYSKILKDKKNKTIYNLILKKYIENNIKIYIHYNKVSFKLFDIAFDTLYLSYNTLQSDFKINPLDTLFPILIVVLNFYFEYIEIILMLDQNKYNFLKTKEQINIYLNDIIHNSNIISESNTFSKEFENISMKLEELIKIMNNDDLEISGWLMKNANNEENIYILMKYITYIFIKYNSGITFQLDYIKQQTFIIKERFHELSTYYSDNIETEKILNSIIDDIERNDLFINDSEILFTIENLSHSFGKNIIFKNVSLTILKNVWTCFYGNSGSGKTTLCNILLKQLEPDSCIIKYMGLYPNYKYTDICKDISYVTACPEVFENTIKFNILYGVDNSEDKEIQDKMNHYIKLFGLDICDLNDNVNTLSTGQKQRVSIIRLILHDRPIMILDEITSNIDNEMEKIILEEIRKIQKEKNKTVIHITHNCENRNFSDINLYILNKDIIRVK